MNIEELDQKILTLSQAKDNAVKAADYILAAKIRNQLDALKMEKRQLQVPRIESEQVSLVNAIFEKISQKIEQKKQAQEDIPYAWKLPGSRVELIRPTGGRPPMTIGPASRIPIRAEEALRHILEATNPSSPGLYEAITVEKVNNLARRATGISDAPRECWSHHRPVSDDAPREISPDILAAYQVLYGKIIKEALDKLSGTLSHDNVAAAKQILKKILD